MVKTNDTTNHKAKIFLGVIFLKFSLALGFVNLNSTEEMQISNKSYKKNQLTMTISQDPLPLESQC